MGCCSTVNHSSRSTNISNTPPPANLSKLKLTLNTQYSPYLELTHSLNVNNKYDNFFIYDRTGKGIKKTNAYTSKVNPDELKKMREEFWETRVQGNKQLWNVLREACQTDEDTARLLIEESGFILIKDSIQLVCDARGKKHDLPIFIINEPSGYKEYEAPTIDKNEEIIKIKARRIMSEDIEIEISNYQKVKELKQIISTKGNIDKGKMRLFFGGKELKEDIPLFTYNITNEMVIIIFEKKD